MSRKKTHDFTRAVNKAIEEQILPQIFSAEQLAEMKQPYHETVDHYSFVNMNTAEKAFAEFYNIKPQLMIQDLRITDEQLAAAPHSLKVVFEGKTHDIPLRIYRYSREKNLQDWQKNLDFTYVSREAVAKLEPGLKEKFNLVSGKDYHIAYGASAVENDETRTQVAAFYLVQIWNRKALKQEAAIQKHVEEQLKVITPGRPSKVMTSGPAEAL